jgi:outer membrane protein assembly factor BamB
MTTMRAVPCVIVGAVLVAVASWQCGGLLNSQRAFSTAPIVQPIWRADIATDVRPIVQDDAVVIVGTGKGETTQRVFALRAATGEQLWRTDFEAESVERVAGGFVHVNGKDGIARAVHLQTGDEESHRSGPARFVSFTRTANRVFGITLAGALVALTPQGSVAWQVTTPLTSVTEPMVYDGIVCLHGSRYVEGSKEPRRHFLIAYDEKSGDVRWKHEAEPGLEISAPVVRDGLIYFRQEGKSKTSSTPIKNPDGSTTYPINRGVDEHLLHAREIATGKDRWTRPTNGAWNGDLGGPKFLLDESVLLITEGGKVEGQGTFYRAVDVRSGNSLWDFIAQFGDHQRDRATASQGVIVARDTRVNVLLDTGGNSIPDSWLCAIDAKTGQDIWQSPPVALSHFTWPVAAGDLVFVGSRAGSWQGKQYDGTGAVFAFKLRPDG